VTHPRSRFVGLASISVFSITAALAAPSAQAQPPTIPAATAGAQILDAVVVTIQVPSDPTQKCIVAPKRAEIDRKSAPVTPKRRTQVLWVLSSGDPAATATIAPASDTQPDIWTYPGTKKQFDVAASANAANSGQAKVDDKAQTGQVVWTYTVTVLSGNKSYTCDPDVCVKPLGGGACSN